MRRREKIIKIIVVISYIIKDFIDNVIQMNIKSEIGTMIIITDYNLSRNL